MTIINNEQLICVDVDETVVIWPSPQQLQELPLAAFVEFIDPYDGEVKLVMPHLPNIKVLKDRKKRGCAVLVWSQSGYAWAIAAINALKLHEHVDFVASKPFMIIDDLPAEAWMRERVWLKPDSNWAR